ncbi:MAG: DUF2867 domain-containing protein [Labilithrix sp.]|nr:DUF2867 domain-containing protein [Labilithrix sp.]
MRSLVSALPFMDHADAFRVKVDATRIASVDAFAHAFLRKPPPWIAAAMRTRDAVVGLFGLKKSSAAPSTLPPSGDIAPGARAGIFRVIDRTDDEILLGEDDRHLDFRVSLLYEREPESDVAFVTVSTVVRFHDVLGRAYFLPVRPVHGLVVPAMMRSALEHAPA